MITCHANGGDGHHWPPFCCPGSRRVSAPRLDAPLAVVGTGLEARPRRCRTCLRGHLRRLEEVA